MDRDHREYVGGGGYDRAGDRGTNYNDGFKKATARRSVVDYGSTVFRWMQHRIPRYRGGVRNWEFERPSASYIIDMLAPAARPHRPADSIPAKHIHSSLNKIKHPVNVVRWTPAGRRCLTGSSSGEFTLWNGTAFNFETIMQAHDSAIRAATYSHSQDWLVSADHNGIIKYWQTNFNNVKQIDAHTDPIRDIAFAPNDSKFVTACDDATLKIFDFASSAEESTLTGHGWDAKTCDWHPTKGLLVSGSKDHQVKLWDPRTSRCLTTLHGHKNTVSKVAFEPQRGQLLASCARDSTTRVFDIRMMRDVFILRGHEKDIATLTWHPIHPSFLSTGGADGSIFHYLLDEPHTPPGQPITIPPYDSNNPQDHPSQAIYPAHRIPHAHEFAVWSLAWHPLGHILASGSNDRITRFWTRPRPGEIDCFNDRYHLGEAGAEAYGTWDRRAGHKQAREEEEQELEDEAEGLVDQKMPSKQSTIPGLPGLTLPFADVVPTMEINSQNGYNAFSALPLELQAILPPPQVSFPPDFPSPGTIAGMNPERFAALIREGKLVPPPPIPGQAGGVPPPPPPLPPGFDLSKIDISKLPPGLFPPPLPASVGAIGPGLGEYGLSVGLMSAPMEGVERTGSAGARRRAPLPSQEESLKEEQRRGKYRIAR